jgi:undecaprenyl-phosphate 4-deoxy-4-formamido-L-arabinose transferase
MFLSVVIPVYNAEATIGDLCRALISLLQTSCRLEIILVNDFSLDGSDAACKAIQGEYPALVTYARLARNFGEHSAVMSGLHLTKGDYIVIMDDDFQNPPEEVPKLLAEIQKGFDVVYCRYPVKSYGAVRNFCSFLNGAMARLVLDKPAGLYLSSFKIMHRFLVNEIIKFDSPKPYLDAIILRTTASIGTIEVRHDTRKVGSSNYNFRKLIALWCDIMFNFSIVPLRCIELIGALVAAYGLTHMLMDCCHYAGTVGIEGLFPTVIFFAGLQILCIGIVGEYVSRKCSSSNPQFVIRELRPALSEPRTEEREMSRDEM